MLMKFDCVIFLHLRVYIQHAYRLREEDFRLLSGITFDINLEFLEIPSKSVAIIYQTDTTMETEDITV